MIESGEVDESYVDDKVRPLYEITPLEGIKNLVGDDVEVIYAEGYEPYYDESLFADIT